MRLSLTIFVVLSLSVFLVNPRINTVSAQEGIVRAKIGIQIRSGDSIIRAKSQDDLNADDLLRIYVRPEKTSYVYIIHSDLSTATLLNMDQQKIQNSTLVMPSLQEFYRVDGKSSEEIFTIIITDNSLNEVMETLRNGKTTYEKWIEVEESLLERSKFDLSQEVEKPFSIAGNVRGGFVVSNIDPFAKELPIFSGKSILVKRYEFRVKK